MLRRCIPVLLFAACASSEAASPRKIQPDRDAVPAPTLQMAPTLYELPLTALDGTPFDAAALKDKAVLFVNVASKCGFTPQYDGLQALYEQYAERGLVIVGVPCNQFGGQEPGDAEQIASFCRMNHGVTFPLLEKQDVNGKERSPLYQLLVDSPVGGGAAVKWNFEKFLVAPTGEVVGRFPSATKPDAPKLITAIEAALPTR